MIAANIHGLCLSEFFKLDIGESQIGSYSKKKKFITGLSRGRYCKRLCLNQPYGGLLLLSVST